MSVRRDLAEVTRQRDEAREFVEDLAVLFPVIEVSEGYPDEGVHWTRLIPFGVRIWSYSYRVGDVHTAAESIRAQWAADAEARHERRAAKLVAEFRGEKVEDSACGVASVVHRLDLPEDLHDVVFNQVGRNLLSRVVVEDGADSAARGDVDERATAYISINCTHEDRVGLAVADDACGGFPDGGGLGGVGEPVGLPVDGDSAVHDSSPVGCGSGASTPDVSTVSAGEAVDTSPVGGVAGAAGGVAPATVNAVERGRVMAEVRSQLRAAFNRGDEAEIEAWSFLLSREFHRAMLAHEDAVEARQIRAEEVRE